MKLNFDEAFLAWFRGKFPATARAAEGGDLPASGSLSDVHVGWHAARATPITLPARTETLPTGDAFATERANGRNQALKECAAMLKAQGFKVVGYE